MSADERSSALGDAFDHTVRTLDGLPNTVRTGAATLRMIHPVLGVAQTFIVQTFRQKDDGAPSKDTILIEFMSANGVVRIALPPIVADTIARQRDALATKNRKRAARANAADRKARGIQPGFMKGRKKS